MQIRNALKATALVATVGLFLAGCSASGTGSGGGSAGTTIQIGSINEPQNLDNTAGGGSGVTEALSGNVYEELFKLEDDGTTTPQLATSFTVSPDGLTYTFPLRKNVKFHSGATMTSQDVKFSLEKVIAPDSQSARKSNLQVIKSIDTPDADTVVVHLNQRSISFIHNLSYPWIINHTATDLKTTEDGTGPYTLKSWKHGSSLTETKFADYWGTAPKNDTVVFNYYKSASAENNALQSGQVDVITTEPSPDALAQFANNPQFTVAEGKSTVKQLLAFNDRVKPFNDARVRVALTRAIDRPALLTSIWGDHGQVTGSMVPPTDPWYVDYASLYPFDQATADSELAAAGYPEGFTFTLETPNYDPHPAVAQFIKAELAKIGVTVNIDTITSDQWYTKVYQNRDFQATLQEHVNDRDVTWYGNPDFYWGYDNPTVTKLVAQAEESKTTDEQTATLKKANEIIVKDAASDWLYLTPQIVVAKSSVHGYLLNGLNSQFYVYGITKN